MNRYYLFGSAVCNLLDDTEDITYVIGAIEAGEGYDIFKWTPESNPSDLLAVYNGWLDFMEITEEQYEQLKNLHGNGE